MGMTVQAYQSDHATVATYGFIVIEKGIQNIKFSGVGAHHQNGTAKCTIQTILTKARTILLLFNGLTLPMPLCGPWQ